MVSILERKTILILLIILSLAFLLGGSFLQTNDVYANPRGGYTTAEISSAVVVVNGGNILTAEYDNLVIRANEPNVNINIFGSGFERSFNITVKNIDLNSIQIEGEETGSLLNGTNYVQFISKCPPRLVKNINLSQKSENKNFSFALIGDSRDNPQVFKKILNEIENSKSRFIIHQGDMVSQGTQNEYADFIKTIGSSKVPIYTVPGNHDIIGKGRLYYSQEFGMYYYSFNVDTTHFIILDNANGYLDEEQLIWLKDDLEKNKGSMILVFMHMPPFDPRLGEHHAMSDSLQAETLVSLFEDFNVDTVFASHIHSYHEYSLEGVHYIISGGGGAPLVDNGEYHYIIANILNGKITAEMILV